MNDKKADTLPDIDPLVDRGESIGLMEPLVIGEGSKHRSVLADKAVELAVKSEGFRRSLPPGIERSLADLVRSMNCYYSNLIEGHNTHPIDIERALKDDYSDDTEKRNLQLEAKAHISVQQWIDDGSMQGKATSQENIKEIHRRFCSLVPEDLLWAENPETKERAKVIPGHWRGNDVIVGRHVAISPGAIPRFVERYENVYDKLGTSSTIIAAAAAHHRLLWIHPFTDGNGRVARLVSYAMLRDATNTGGLWSVARGLARNALTYKQHLAACDLERRNDLDGRGHLSEEALGRFTEFFLDTCLDQIAFMEGLIQPEKLRTRIQLWAEEEIRLGSLPAKTDKILETILYRGAMARGEIAKSLDLTERHARRLYAPLIEKGILVAETSKAPLRLAFPAAITDRWLPGLFPG